MCILNMSAGLEIMSDYDAREWLRGHGFDDYDMQELAAYLMSGDLAEMELELDELREERKKNERYQDGLYTALVDALNFTDDMLRKARTKEARQLLQAVKDEIEHSEVF